MAGVRAITLMVDLDRAVRQGREHCGALRRAGGRRDARCYFRYELSEIESRERLGEAAGVRLLGLGEGLEPLGHVVEALLAGLLRHARVHRLVLVRVAGDGALEVLLRAADGQAGGRVARG